MWAECVPKAQGGHPPPVGVDRTKLQKAAAAWALGVAALLVILTVVPPRTGIPPVLLGLFVGLWVFGATMLWYFPLFGAAGTAAWGLLSGGQALAMHGTSPQNLLVVVASFVGAALALAHLAEWWRKR